MTSVKGDEYLEWLPAGKTDENVIQIREPVHANRQAPSENGLKR